MDRSIEDAVKAQEIAEKTVKEAEEQESSSSGDGGNAGSVGRQESGSPMLDSRLPGGRAREAPLREARRANPGEAWGAMPPEQRERVLQALRDSFPSRYRQLVEQYYEQLSKKP